MPLETINIGTNPNDKTGDNLRAACEIINAAIAAINGLSIGENQNANLILCGPATGNPALPTFRAIVAADLGSGSSVTTKYLRGDLTWQTVSGGGGVTSLGGQTGAITLSGLAMAGSVLTVTPYSPAQFATDSALSPAAGTFTALDVERPTGSGRIQGWGYNGAEFLILSSDGVGNAVWSSGQFAGNGFTISTRGALQFTPITTPTLPSGTAGTYSKAVAGNGEMFVKNELGGETMISGGDAASLSVTRTVGTASTSIATSIGPGATVTFNVTLTGYTPSTDSISLGFDSIFPGWAGSQGGITLGAVFAIGGGIGIQLVNTDLTNTFTPLGNVYVKVLR